MTKIVKMPRGLRALLSAAGIWLTLGAAMAGSAAAAGEDSPVGTWRLGKGKLVVRVDYCDGQKLCANIVGLRKPLDRDGNPKLDKENPNKSLRNRPIIGLQIIDGMKPDGDNRWVGSIYNADDGGTYRATARVNDNKFMVRGCWGPFCKDLTFSRAGVQKAAQP